ncbi:addiction module antitoxin [Ruegeria sp. ANG-R]|uniref:addiction module antidote protein n=1 Tax=Ruegeria sp. ANG-R TaxID=1577903 RepID=UPI00057D5716|nr:addiction module antidote protein [Ruegeria sp. ANG-R]KIC35908.1 addiction module antitoxin [Ruegeria sp. ANG-R]
MTIETTPFDAVEYLGDAESQAVLLNDAFESGDPHYIAHALGIIARARGMTQLSRDSGETREALHKALSKDGDPRLSALTSVLSALGVTVRADMAAATQTK